MGPFVVVEGNILIYGLLVDGWFLFQVVQTFLLNGSVKPFQVSIVIGFSDPAVAMGFFGSLRKPFGKFRSMIRLQHLEWERRFLFCLLQKLQCASCSDPRGNFGIGPSAMHIEQGVDVEALAVEGMNMDGINLH